MKTNVKRGGKAFFSYNDETGDFTGIRQDMSWEDAVEFRDAIDRFKRRRDPDPAPASGGVQHSDFLSNNINDLLPLPGYLRIRRAPWWLRKFVPWVLIRGGV